MSGWNKNSRTLRQEKERKHTDIDIMTPGERQCDIAVIIGRKQGRDLMTLRERCTDTGTVITMVREG